MRAYNSYLVKHPVITKSITSAFLGGLGDMICQKIEGKKVFDFKRTITFSTVGLIYIGPMLHMNYSKFLPALVANKGSATS